MAIVFGASVAASAPTAHAGGVITVCDEASLDAAIAGGGPVSFACDGTVLLTSTKTVGNGVSLTIDGAGRDVTIAAGGSLQLFNVAPYGSLRLRDLVITDGSAPRGGAVFSQGTLSVDKVSFLANTATDVRGEGGAIWSGPGANLVVDNSSFVANSAPRGSGGAIANVFGTATINNSTFARNDRGAILNVGTIHIAGTLFEENTGGAFINPQTVNSSPAPVAVIVDSVFKGNSATSGGAINNCRGCRLEVTRCLFAGNTAGSGGGAIATLGEARIVDSVLTDNAAESGGAVESYGVTSIERTIFTGNSAARGGGAVESFGWGSRLEIYDSAFSQNSASDGGGGAVAIHIGAIERSTFAANSASVGGAVMTFPTSGEVSIINTTLTGNSASRGGAIANLGSLQLTNTTVAENWAPDAAVTNQAAPGFQGTLTVTNSIVAGGLASFDCWPLAMTVDGGGNVVEDGSCGFDVGGDPQLGPLQDNGGPTMTMAIPRSSPAFRAGVENACNAGSPAGANGIDQRGIIRSPSCSAGAYEPYRRDARSAPHFPVPGR